MGEGSKQQWRMPESFSGPSSEGHGALGFSWESQVTSHSCLSPSFSVSLGLLLVLPLSWSPSPPRHRLTLPSPLLHVQVPLLPSGLSQPVCHLLCYAGPPRNSETPFLFLLPWLKCSFPDQGTWSSSSAKACLNSFAPKIQHSTHSLCS